MSVDRIGFDVFTRFEATTVPVTAHGGHKEEFYRIWRCSVKVGPKGVSWIKVVSSVITRKPRA